MSRQSATARAAESKFLAEMRPAVEQFRTIAAQAGDALFLSNRPVNPDHELLELCADALHFSIAANHAYDSRPVFSYATDKTKQQMAEWKEEDEQALNAYYSHTNEVTQRLRRAKKMKAQTPAGIYAKALLVRCSKTGAAELAMSLAVDLVNCKPLRGALWAASPYNGAPAPEATS